MKINKFLMGLGAVAALSLGACSNDDPVAPGTNPEEAAYGDQYLTVSVMMPDSNGSRAEGQGDNDKDKYDEGTPEESQVSNIVFFFFDANNNVIDIQKDDKPSFEYNSGWENNNPYVSYLGKKEVRLKSGLNYKQVAVVLNTSATSASDLITEIKNLSDLTSRLQDYADQVHGDGTHQVMSNSVFYNTTDRTVAPSANTKYILVPITEKNIYTDAQRTAGIDKLFASGDKEIVDIYVERVASKVSVESNINLADYVTDNQTKAKTITLYDNVELTTKTVVIRPEIKGITLTVTADQATLIKNISSSQLGYNNPVAQNFLWNDPLNKRSYWATTPAFGKEGMTYYSWKAVEEDGLTSLTAYINPNTQDFEVGKEDRTLNTKVMAVAQLFAYDVNDTKYENPIEIDLVKYGSEYMESSNLKAQVANLLNVAARSINWDMLGKDYTAAEIEVLKVVVNNSFVDGISTSSIEIKASGKDDDTFDTYSAVVNLVEGFDYEITVDQSLFDDYNLEDKDVDAAMKALLADADALEALITKAKENNITPAIDSELESINKHNILYWKGGKTYFYTTIRHQGFYGLAGGEKYLNGVVRNHIYNVSLDGIYGLGTPVIDPGKPIDPERPVDERPSYLQARINILPWRVVTNSATIH